MTAIIRELMKKDLRTIASETDIVYIRMF